MKSSLGISLFLVLYVCLINTTPANAAYIDPNTGGMLFQVLAVLFGVISALFLVFSSKIKMLFYRITRYIRESSTEPGEDSEPNQ